MARISKEARKLTRERLLFAAADAFAEHGLEGANINEISLAAGLAKGTVYNYFPSKEALFLAVVREACARAARDAELRLEDESTAAKLRALLESDMAWVQAHEPFARVLIREALKGDPRFYPQVIEAAAPFFSRLEEILGEGVARGEIRGDVPIPQLTLLFVGLGDIALVQHWGSGAWPSFEEIPDFVLRSFLEGAAPRPEEK